MAGILDDLAWRGLIAQSTDPDALRTAMLAQPLSFYCGFDPTAPSLHIGNLVQLLTARRLQQSGHKPFLLVGGATGLVGDPSGKATERMLNNPDVVAGWVDRLRAQIEPYFEFGGSNAATIVNNLDWTARLSAIDLLRDVGKHFGVNRMLAREAVSARLEAGGITFTEFSYQVLQANDYLELYRRSGCTLQTGGSDEWGNLTAGVDLVRRATGVQVHALATPLITKADGAKFGKTEAGTVWLDRELTTPYAFYQFWLNADDRDISGWLRAFSSASREEIEALERESTGRPEARLAQRALAGELTALVHGQDECRRATAASRALFGQGDLEALDEGTLAAALSELPRTTVAHDERPTVVELLVATGLCQSRSAARRTVAEGGAYVNNRRVAGIDDAPRAADLLHGRWLLLRRGRRTLAAVVVPDALDRP